MKSNNNEQYELEISKLRESNGLLGRKLSDFSQHIKELQGVNNELLTLYKVKFTYIIGK